MGAWKRSQKVPVGTLGMVTAPAAFTLPGNEPQAPPAAGTRAATALLAALAGAAGAVAPASGQ